MKQIRAKCAGSLGRYLALQRATALGVDRGSYSRTFYARTPSRRKSFAVPCLRSGLDAVASILL